MNNVEYNFFNLCYDCLYYGYTYHFIKENYLEYFNTLGVEKCDDIFDKAFDKISSEE